MESPQVGEIDTIARVCGHCGTRTVFRVLAIDINRTEVEMYGDESCGQGDVIYEAAQIDTLRLLKCQTCSKVTLEETTDYSFRDPEMDYRDPEYQPPVYIRYPVVSKAPPATEDMPNDVATIYEEAREVLPYSPKASAALLRLAIAQLCQYLGKPGRALNDDISELVKEGLSLDVQQALDSVRVIGNNAVHPGNIVFNDNPEIVGTLFVLVNFIVEEMITRPLPRKIKKFYESLPQKHLDEIEKRKQKSAKSEKTSRP